MSDVTHTTLEAGDPSLTAGVSGMRHDATSCGAFVSNALPKPPSRTVASPAGHPGNVLSPTQQTAIALLVAGRSFASVASSLKLHRSTISRWRNQHPLFAAELARRQRDVYDTASRRLQLLMVKAIGVINESLSAPRYRNEAAWKVLSGLKAAQWAAPVAPTDSELNEWPDEPELTQASAKAEVAAPASQPPSPAIISPGTSPASAVSSAQAI